MTKFNYIITIRKDFVNELNLKQKEIVDINIEKIENLSRTKDWFYKDKIDILSFIPKETFNKYKIFVSNFYKNNEEWLRIWYAHDRGSGAQLELKRFNDIKKFGSLLGQYQAEGSKPIDSKYSKYRIEFKNKLIIEHKEFLESLFDLGININNIYARFHYNPLKLSEKEVEDYILKFKSIIEITPKIAPHIGTKGIGFGLSINNTILMEIILNSLEKIRNSFWEKNINSKNYELLVNNFFAKLLAGDGTLYIRKRSESSFEATILIYDCNINYLKNYQRLMNNLGFKTNIKGKICVKSYCKFEQLMYLYNINAFSNTKNWYRILIAIDLYSKRKNNPIRELTNCKEDLINLKKEKGIVNSLSLLNSLKAKPNRIFY